MGHHKLLASSMKAPLLLAVKGDKFESRISYDKRRSMQRRVSQKPSTHEQDVVFVTL